MIRKILEEDIKIISEWFKDIAWDLPAVESILPKDGFISFTDDNKPTACLWWYITGTSFSQFGWTATNPKATSKEQSEGLEGIIKLLQDTCENGQMTPKNLTTYTKNENFMKKLLNLGFRKKFPYYQMTWVAKTK